MSPFQSWATDVLTGRIARGNRYYGNLRTYFERAEAVSSRPSSFKRAFIAGTILGAGEWGRRFLNGTFSPSGLLSHVRTDAQMLGLFRGLCIIAGSTYLFGPGAPSDQELAQYRLTRDQLAELLQDVCLSAADRAIWDNFRDTYVPAMTTDAARWAVGASKTVWQMAGGGAGMPDLKIIMADSRHLFELVAFVRGFVAERHQLRKEWEYSDL